MNAEQKRTGLWSVLVIVAIALMITNVIETTLAGTSHHLNTTPTVLHTNSIPRIPADVTSDASGHVVVLNQEGEIYSLSSTGAILVLCHG